MALARSSETLVDLGPREAAARLIDASGDNLEWLDAFAEHLDRRRAGEALERVLDVWDLNRSEAAERFGVSRQAVSKWIARGVPAERAEAIADLAAATDLLVRYVKRDRIPAVVRRRADGLGGKSLLDLLAASRTRQILEATRTMFDWARTQA
ncbi:hypothetical protein BH24PSE2_BH24PSE2_13100 [soil metagenome]